jgi:hypothetical protein
MDTELNRMPRRSESLFRSFGLAAGVGLLCILLLDYAAGMLLHHYSLVLPGWYSLKFHVVFSTVLSVVATLPPLYASPILRGIRREMRTGLLVFICFALVEALRLAIGLLFMAL